jgi:hypothetical protein
VTKDSLTDKSVAFENKVYFNLKGKLLDLKQEEEKKKIEFKEILEKIEKNQTELLCKSVMNKKELWKSLSVHLLTRRKIGSVWERWKGKKMVLQECRGSVGKEVEKRFLQRILREVERSGDQE